MIKKIKYLLSFSPYGLYELFRDKKRAQKSIKNQKTIIDNYVKNHDVRKLQIGTGSNILKGWLNTDLNDSNEIAYLDAGAKFPLESDSFDYVYSEHLFEHLKVEQQVNMLQESYRILKKGGVMRIATPTLDFLFKLYNNPEKPESKDYVEYYINHFPQFKKVNELVIDKDEHYNYVINNFFKAWGHQVIHNFSSISKLALQCNYTQVKQTKVGESDIACFQNIEKHGTIIPERINEFETMVVEIIK
ncbi:class I SAM-dependent methyltransferase [Flavobacterium urocaniciphilum]|uniref:Methyltransferase domain-containing protein n=1 Tax=Flavobacterium urocaniciphilum TaxID=1299341 RepID=A0A1H8YRU8_9FLAO|nr:methyltransferase domain-containing protein [Flavobacterium urocaniciphilum]SEP54867.1 Methyltransferase domain-containing protein [Flavobacterium urocaniciphilum]